MATVTGGNGNDTLSGTNQLDVISGAGGNDFLNALTKPADSLFSDFVSGGLGIDTLVVNAAAESQSVRLTVAGNPRFFVRSDSGNFSVDAANDIERARFTGGSGNDIIQTADFAASINGGAGIDFWSADLSAQTAGILFTLGVTTAIPVAGLGQILNIEKVSLTLGSGNDTITGGGQTDFVAAGGGNDRINVRTRPSSEGAATVEVVSGGAGIDTLVVNAAAETQSVQLDIAGNPRFFVRSNSGNFQIDAANDVEKIEFTGGSGNDVIETDSFGVVVKGGGGIDQWIADLSATAANIVFNVASTTSIAAAGLTAIGGLEQIRLTTGAGNDTITGGNRTDFVATGGGNDRIDVRTRPSSEGAATVEVVSGGAGIDTLVVNAAAETQSVQLDIAGNPRFFVRSNSGNFRIDAANDVEKIEFTGGRGNDVIETDSFGVVVKGGAGIDHWIADLSATAADIAFNVASTTSIAAAGLTAIAGLERISLRTGAGSDTIIGGNQTDFVESGAGNDRIDVKTRPKGEGAATVEVVSGGAGIDTLVVNAAAETQSVQLDVAGNPRFFVRSNSGNFQIDAANDVERIEFTGGSGNDDIETFSFGAVVRGGAGIDHWTADYSALAAKIVFNLANTKSIAAGGLQLVNGIERLSLATGSGDDVITAGNQLDVILTNAGNDSINVGAKPQNLNAVEVVDGGLGVDTLVVDAQSESQGITITVAGNPSFFVRSASNRFAVDASGIEKLVFFGGGGADTVSGRNDNDRLRGGAGADSINGNAGNDSLTGGRGADTLVGGGGVDRFIYGAAQESSAANGIDQISFNKGKDKVDLLAVDANGNAGGNQAFAFIGNAAFTAAGQLRAVPGRVEGDVNGDGVADLVILTGPALLAAGDFIL